MIYQLVIAKLKILDDLSAIKYATDNAFELVELSDKGYSIDELVQVCLDNK
jgi:hypothetical protein